MADHIRLIPGDGERGGVTSIQLRPGFFVALALLLGSSVAAANPIATFTPVLPLPGHTYSQALDVSGDGSVVVGTSGNPDRSEAFRWTADGGVAPLGTPNERYAQGTAVSDDGLVVVGYSVSESFEGRAFRWSAGTGTGFIEPGLAPPNASYINNTALDVSADGSVVAGQAGWYTNGVSHLQPFRWSSNGEVIGLGPEGARTFAVSGDGSVVVGTTPLEAFRWTEAGGTTGLGTLPGTNRSEAHDVSADGSVVVGVAEVNYGSRAFRWTSDTGMRQLGTLPGMQYISAEGVSAGGSIVVGGTHDLNGEAHAFIWNPVLGMRDLQQLLVEDYGVEIPAGWTLEWAAAISSDGHTIVGTGYDSNANFDSLGWIVTIPELPVPEPSTGLLLGLGIAVLGLHRGA